MSELLVRRATAADAAALVAFNADVSRYQDAAQPDGLIAAWTRDLMAGRHPRVDASDFVVTEDSRGAIVSALGLISQKWSYDGVDIEVGQPELVGTHPDYRGRGLIRRQFEVIHRWSAERGQKLLAIDGIPGFYRQFGYEMALELRGELSIDGSVPPLSGVEPYHLRPAADADLPFIGELYAAGAARCLVACPRDAALWRYELHGRSETNPWRPALRIVESIDKEPVAVFAHVPRLSGSRLMLTLYEVRPCLSWHDVTPSVLRALCATGEAWRRILHSVSSASGSASARRIRRMLRSRTSPRATRAPMHGTCASPISRIFCGTSRPCWSGGSPRRPWRATPANC